MDDETPELIAASDRLLDRIAAGRPVILRDALAALLAAWRADIYRDPIPDWVAPDLTLPGCRPPGSVSATPPEEESAS